MTERDYASNVREAVAVFGDVQSLQGAIDELRTSGFSRADLSLLASEDAVTQKLGHRYQKASDLEDEPDTPRAAYVSPESIGGAEGGVIGALIYVGAGILMGPVAATGGSLAAIIGSAALGAGAGGAIGTLFATFIGDRHAEYIQEQVSRGGLLLWVRTWDHDQEQRAVDILTRNSGQDVHVHEFPNAV